MYRVFVLSLVISVILNILIFSPGLRAEDIKSTQSQEQRIKVLEQKLQSITEELKKMKSGAFSQQDERLERIEVKLSILADEIQNVKSATIEEEPREIKEVHGHSLAASKVYSIGKGVSIGGYGEINGQIIDNNDNIADALRAVLYVGYKYNDWILFNSEIEFEHASTSTNRDGQSGEVSVEFANIDFLLSRYINFRSGLNLVPIGIVNEKHEPTTFHGTLRPDVERQVIPSTWREIGVGVFGNLVPGLSYRAYVINGLDARGIKASNIRSARNKGNRTRFNDVAFVSRVEYEPIHQLNLATSFYIGNTGQNEKVDGKTIDGRFTMLEADYSFQWQGLESRALFVYSWLKDSELINQLNGFEDSDSVGKRMYGFYVEGAYNVFTHLFDTNQYLAPFIRYEQYDTQHKIPSGFASNPANDRKTITYGISYRPIPNVVLKLDFQDRRNKADTADNQFNMGIGWVF